MNNKWRLINLHIRYVTGATNHIDITAYKDKSEVATVSGPTGGGCTHAHADPTLKWGHDWKGWISHLFVMKPGTASMGDYFDDE